MVEFVFRITRAVSLDLLGALTATFAGTRVSKGCNLNSEIQSFLSVIGSFSCSYLNSEFLKFETLEEESDDTI